MKNRQYTIRNISPQLDSYLRQKSRESGKSLNEVAIEALGRGSGLSEVGTLFHDLDHLMGTWKEDRACEEAIAAQDVIDPGMWS